MFRSVPHRSDLSLNEFVGLDKVLVAEKLGVFLHPLESTSN